MALIKAESAAQLRFDEHKNCLSLIKYQKPLKDIQQQKNKKWSWMRLYLFQLAPLVQIFANFTSLIKKIISNSPKIQLNTKKQIAEQSFQQTPKIMIFSIGAGLSGVTLFILYKVLTKMTPEKKAQKIFQLKLNQTNMRQVKWVYQVKKRYFTKFAKENIFYQNKLKELNQSYELFKERLSIKKINQ